jgi:hypothetical protein
MTKKLFVATLSAALCLMPVSPAIGMDNSYPGLQSPRGANLTANFRIPFGQQRSKPSYGLTAAYGHSFTGTTLNGFEPLRVREVKVADLRFSSDGLQRARVASFDLAEQNGKLGNKRLNLSGDGSTLWIVVGLVAAGVAVCLLADCFEGDDDSSSSSSSD